MFIYRWMHSLETDPAKQFQFHKRATLVWIGLMFLVPFVPPFHFIHHTHDLYSSHTVFDANIFISLLILEISLWANAFTHFGALSSALAAMHGDEYPEPTHDLAGSKIPGFLDEDFDRYNEAADWLDEQTPMDSLIPSELPTDDEDIIEPLINATDVAGHTIPHNYEPVEVPHNLNP